MINWTLPGMYSGLYPRYRNIIMNHGGTIIEHPDDEVQNRRIASAVMENAKKSLKRGKILKGSRDLISLAITKKEIERNLQNYKKGEAHYLDIYDPFNKCVIYGKPVSIILGAVDEYVSENLDKVDKMLLSIVRDAKKRGKRTGIISESYDYAIRKFLRDSGFTELVDPKDIVANTLKSVGDKAIGITTDIYGEKRRVMTDDFFDKRDFRYWETFYIGGSEEDIPVADALPPGHFIVPFYASDDFREHMASKYNARVPETEQDLKLLLRD